MMPTSNSLNWYLRGSLMDLDMTPTCIFLGWWILISATVGFDTYEHLGLLLFWIWWLWVSFWITSIFGGFGCDTYVCFGWIFVSWFDTYVYLSVLIRYLRVSWMDFQIWYLRVSFWLDTYEYLWWIWIWYLRVSWMDFYFDIYEYLFWLIPTSILDLITRHDYLGLWIFSVSNTYEYLRNMVYGLFYVKALIIDVFFIQLHITFIKTKIWIFLKNFFHKFLMWMFTS